MTSFEPDLRYSLKKLAEDWHDCEKCELGKRRASLRLPVVHGKGATEGIMFIGEGPGATEEAMGDPFVGASGEMLRTTLAKLGVLGACYFTNAVMCRACFHKLDKDGQPAFNRRGKRDEPPQPIWEDIPPTPTQMKTCSPRLLQEIYKVDPILMVTLGGTATEFLTGSPITITRDEKPRTIQIPGATHLPLRTDKKKAWSRKIKKQIVTPLIQAHVEYLCIPCVHPAWVLRTITEIPSNDPNTPTNKMIRSLIFAANIYKRHQIECKGEYSLGDSNESED